MMIKTFDFNEAINGAMTVISNGSTIFDLKYYPATPIEEGYWTGQVYWMMYKVMCCWGKNGKLISMNPPPNSAISFSESFKQNEFNLAIITNDKPFTNETLFKKIQDMIKKERNNINAAMLVGGWGSSSKSSAKVEAYIEILDLL